MSATNLAELFRVLMIDEGAVEDASFEAVDF